MEDSAGSADAEMSKVEETITYKINALKETWTGFLQELVNRDAVKGVVDGLTSISEGITSLGAVGTTTLVTGLIAGFKLLSKATDSTGEKIFSFGKIIKSFLGTDVLRSTGLEAYANTLKVITQEQAQASLSTVKLSTAEKELVVSKAGLVAASNVQLTDQQKQEAQILAELIVEKEHLGSINELTVAKVEEAVASEDLTSAEANLVKQRYLSVDASAKETTAFGKLASALNLTKLQLGLIVGAVAAVTAAFVAYYNWDKNYVRNLSDEADEIKSSFQQQKEAADDAVDSIESIKSEYMNLAQGVDSYGNNVGLSNDEFERYEELSKQIGDQFPNLIQGYSDTGTVILTCRDDVNELNTALEELQDNAANALTSKELATLLKNISVQLNGRHTLFSDSYGTLEKEDAIKNLEEGIAQYKELLAQLQKDPDSWETLQFDVNDQLAHLREWASQLGMSDENFIFDMDTDENGVNFVSDDVFNRLGVAVSDLATYRAQLNEEEEQIVSDYQTCVDKFLSSDENLEGLDDDSVNVFKNYLEKIIDPDYINDVIGDAKGQEAVSRVYEDLQEQIEAFTKNKDFSSALKNLFAVSDSETIEDAKEDIDKYIDILAKYLSEDKNELKAKLGVDWADSLSDRNVKAAEYIFNDSITGGNLEAELSKVQSYTDQFTTEQAQKWLGWANDCDQTFTTAADMIAAYEQSLVEAAESSGFDAKTFSKTMASFDDIVEAYDKVKENIQDGKTGEAIASDIEDVEGLRDQFEALGDAADYGDWEDFDDLEKTLTSGTATAEEVQAAWNQLATTFVDAKLAAGDYSEEAQALISTQLQAAGVTKESADAFVASKVAMAEANDMVANSGNSISQAVANEVANLGTEEQQSQLTEQALLELYMQKIATGEITLSTQGDIENLEKLITACNASSAALKDVAAAKSLAGLVEQYEAKIESNPGSARRYQNFIDKANAKISELTKKSADTYLSEAAANQTIHLNGNSTNSSSSGSGSGSGSGSSSSSDKEDDTDKWLEAYEAAYDRLGELRDRDKIDEYEYLEYLRALYEEYFKDKKEYVEEYEQYEYEYLSGMKSLYEDVFSYLTDQIDNQISKLEEQKSAATEQLTSQKTAAVNALKAEKEAAVANIEAQIDAIKEQQDAIQDQIDAYQDEIDAINDANDAREREITLQKALYALDNLNSQRTNLVYSESQGMHYEADLSGIRDAREDVDDAKDDIEIANLEKKIELLEDEKDALDDLIDDLEDQKDAIEDYYDNLIDETEEYWDNLIEESEAYYDSLIDSLEDTKTGIEEFTEAYDKAKQMANFEDLTGIKATDVFDSEGMIKNEELFSQAVSKLQTDYSSLIVSMEEDNSHVLNSFAELTGIDLSSTTGYIEKTAEAFGKFAEVDFDSIGSGLSDIKEIFSSLKEDSEFAATFGQHVGEGLAEALKAAKEAAEEDAEETGTSVTKGVGTGMTSEEAKASVKESAKEVVSEASNSAKESAENGDAKEATDAAGTAIVKTVSDGMTSESATAALDEKSPEVITAAATSVTNAANGEQNADMLTAGEAIVCAIVNAMNSALDGAAGLAGLNTFVTNFAAKLKEQFATLDLSNTLDFNSLLGFSGKEGTDSTTNPLSTFLEQFTTAIEELNKQIETVDISPVVTQFQNLKTAIVAATTAIGGGSGMTEEMGSEGNAMTGGTGTTGTDSTMQSSSSSTSGGGLTEAMETFGSTADQVLGSGGGEEDSEDAEGGEGVIGKFATLKTKVDAVTSAIGLGEEEGGGGSGGQKSGGDDGEGGTLIDALTAEGKVAFNEENGLPAQNKQWTDLESNIGKCIDAVYRLIKALSKLEEFSLSVQFKGSSNAGGSSAEASGTVGYASGSVYVGGSAYAKGKAGLDRNQRALVGEQGVEMLISGNRWQLVGEHGAEYRDLKAGDIIFSASQTKELMQHGKLRSRGHTVGGNAYADGTPLNSLLSFAGKDLSSSALTAIANQLTGAMLPMESNIEAINRNVADMAASISNISSVNNTSNVTIGDIHVTGVQDVDGFAKAIKSYLPGKMTQALYS